MRRTCCSSTGGSVQLVLAGHVDQFVVRNAAPQQEGQARGQFEIGDAVGLARTSTFAGSRSARTRNCGLVRIRRSASSMPSWKVAFAGGLPDKNPAPTPYPAAVTGRRYARRISVVRISLAHGSSWLGIRRPAGVDLANAARILRARGVEWPLDPQNSDRRIILQLRNADCLRATFARIAGSDRGWADSSSRGTSRPPCASRLSPER